MADQGLRVDIYQLNVDWRSEVWLMTPGFWPSERVYERLQWAGNFATWQQAANAAAGAMRTLASV